MVLQWDLVVARVTSFTGCLYWDQCFSGGWLGELIRRVRLVFMVVVVDIVISPQSHPKKKIEVLTSCERIFQFRISQICSFYKNPIPYFLNLL